MRSDSKYVEQVSSMFGLEKSKPVSTPLAACDRDETKRHLLSVVVLLVLLYMGHDRSEATCAICLLACDLCDANEDSL